MAKKKVEKPRREFTKRQLSRWQKEKRNQRIVFGVGIFIIAAALFVVGIGWYIARYQPMHETVIKVNGVEFDMDYYVKMLEYYSGGQSQMDLGTLADSMVDGIQRNELIRQGALELGVSVSDEEIDEKLASVGLPLSEDYRDIIAPQMLYDKLMNEYFGKQVPEYAEQRHVMAMLLESEEEAAEVRARLEAGEDFSKLAGELSLEAYSRAKEGDFGWRIEGILPKLISTAVPDEYAFSHEKEILSQPLYDEEIRKRTGYWLVKVEDRDEVAQHALVQVILMGSAEEAQEARTRLEAGEDFVALVQEISQHDMTRENEGYLDITSPDMMSEAFSEFVFDSEIELGTVSEPIREDVATTTGGYWLVKVAGVDDNRSIEDEDREILKTEIFNEWVETVLDNPENEVESYLDEEKKAWAISWVSGRRN